MKLSLIIPCYNEEMNVRRFFEEANLAFAGRVESYEFIFINDGSKDKTIDVLRGLFREEKEQHIKVIGFSRNFGKEAAIYAGLQNAAGEFTVIIDADLQQPPRMVLEMLAKLEGDDSIDCVAAFQKVRKEGKALSFLKKSFYRFINRISEIHFVTGASDFRLFRRNVREAVLAMPEYFRFSKGLFSWVGFETFYMPYEAEERANGTSSWSFFKLFQYAVEGIVSFTTLPLRFATFLGAAASAAAALYLIVVVIQKLAFSIAIPGYATIVGLILLFGGLQLLVLGIIGEYLARMYVQGKNRPIYITKEFLTYDKRA